MKGYTCSDICALLSSEYNVTRYTSGSVSSILRKLVIEGVVEIDKERKGVKGGNVYKFKIREHITKKPPKHLAYHLIKEHAFNLIRDEADFSNAKHHTNITLSTVIDIFENFEGTTEQKLNFIKEALEESKNYQITRKGKKIK